MLEETKYVITKDTFGDQAVIFSSVKSHDSISGNIIAAGYVTFKKNKTGSIEVVCYGKSVSCECESRKLTDAKLVCAALNPIGLENKLFVPVEQFNTETETTISIEDSMTDERQSKY